MIARKSALIIFMQLINGLLGLVALKFVALHMEPWEYGIVGFAYGFIALFSIFGKLGYDEAHIKKVSEGKNFSRCIGTFAIIKTFLAGLFAGLVFLSVFLWNHVLGRGFETPLHEKAIFLMLPYFVLLTLTQSMIYTFNARKEITKTQLPLFAYTLVRVLLTIMVVFCGWGVLALIYAYIFGEIFQFIFSLYFFKRYKIGKPSFEYFKNYSKFAMPMAVASASFIIMTNIDKVLIQLFWSSTQVGEYFAVYNLSRFVILFVTSVGVLLLPTISENHAKNNFDKIKNLVLQSERYLSMIVFPIIFILAALAYPVIHILLSDKYLPALPVLYILPFFIIFEALSRPYTTQLQGSNMPQKARNRVILMAGVNVFLNLVLIPKDIQSLGIKCAGLGAEGAAIATVIAYLVGLIYIRVVSWKISGIKGSRCIFLHGFAAFFSGLVVYYLSCVIVIDRWYALIFIALFGFLLYFVILFVLREFKKQDFYLFVDTLNIKKMFGYIIGEIRHKK